MGIFNIGIPRLKFYKLMRISSLLFSKIFTSKSLFASVICSYRDNDISTSGVKFYLGESSCIYKPVTVYC